MLQYHHYYRHPGPFDDLFSHPLENASYLLLLTSPALLWPLKLHVATFGAYVASMGLFTMLDHAGLQADIPGVSEGGREAHTHQSRQQPTRDTPSQLGRAASSPLLPACLPVSCVSYRVPS